MKISRRNIPSVVVDIPGSKLNDPEYDLDHDLFVRSISGYMYTFRRLPKKGLKISNGNCDHATITRVIYNGIENCINVLLEFE